MPDTLKSIVGFVDVPAGASASKPHNLNILGGRKEIPDYLNVNNGAFDATADETNVTVTNNGTVAGSVDVLCEMWHSTPRAFGTADPNSTESLPVRPYVPASGAGSAAKDELVKVSPADTTPGMLDTKVGAGSGVAIAIANPGADETAVISVSDADAGNIKTGAPITVTGPTNAEGASVEIARANHQHRLEMAAQDEGVAAGARPTFNFVGVGVGAVDNPGQDRVDITIPGDSDGGAVVKRSLYRGNSVSTSGTNFVDGMSGLSVAVPIDGDYWAIFESEVENQSGSGVMELGISVNSVVAVVADSERSSQGPASNLRPALTTVQLGALTAGDLVRALFRRAAGAGTVTLRRRHLSIFKVQ